jgi:hypothetical protein
MVKSRSFSSFVSSGIDPTKRKRARAFCNAFRQVTLSPDAKRIEKILGQGSN